MNNSSIVFVNDSLSLERGGAGKMMMFVANICAPSFKKVYVLLMNDAPRPQTLDERITYITVPCPHSSNVFVWRTKAIIKVRRALKKLDYDMVCSFTTETSVMVKLSTLFTGKAYISAERGDPYSFSLLWRILSKWCYGNSDFCFFQLDNARDFFSEKVRRKSYVIPNPYLPPSIVEPYNGPRKKTIVSAGRFAWEKGYEVLIKVFAQVYQKYPEYKLIIYGDGGYGEVYKKLVNELGLNEEVLFPGYVKDVAKTIREDGIFVLSSRYEGMPNSLIDALSIGIPCVATDCTPGGPMFLTNNGKNGIIVPIDDEKQMYEAIINLIEDEELYKRLEHDGPSIINVINEKNIRAKWEAAFSDICNKLNRKI